MMDKLFEYPLYIFSVWRFRDLCYLANFPTFEDDSIDMVSTIINEPRHVISNNVAFWQVQTRTSLCSLLLSLETPNGVQLVAQQS